MESIMLSINLELMVMVLSLACIILLIMNIISLVNIKKLNKKLGNFMGSKSSGHEIGDIVLDYYRRVDIVENKYSQMQSDIDNLYRRFIPCIQKMGIVRYNPFNDMGGDLSYALALLDEKDNGFILNTIFSREGSHTYCKPITRGNSEYTLSYEEELSLKRALGLEKKQSRGTEARAYTTQ